MAVQNIFYNWQNPELRKTIYPFREKKLRDFLLIYREIDLWKAMSRLPVNPQTAAELVHEHTRLKSELSKAELEREVVKEGLKAQAVKFRAALGQKSLRELAQRKINLQTRLAGLESKKKALQRQVDWYQKFAPEHPYSDKWLRELEAAEVPYQQVRAEFEAVVKEHDAVLAPFETETKTLNERAKTLDARIVSLKDEIKKLPALDRNGAVTQSAAVRWLIFKYECELLKLDHDRLVAAVMERFEAEPKRFPKWLQYMVIHFSGMRYKSAHGSWANPRDLLEMLKIEELKVWTQSSPPGELEQACSQATAGLLQFRSTKTNPVEIRQIDAQLAALANQPTRQSALLKYLSAQAVEEIRKLAEVDVLARLEAMKDQFPAWAWKEIVSRTNLRLKFAEKNWEELTPQERQESWSRENQHWRALLDFWERKDITGWRKQHELTLSLVVTRAVCNEIAEHIQHLRGVKPAAGLTAKPPFYLKKYVTAYGSAVRDCDSPQDANLNRPYFTSPGKMKRCDFKPGASILFLGWVNRKPNPWQIAHPLDGVDLLPPEARPPAVKKRAVVKGQGDAWIYRVVGNEFVRTCQPMISQIVENVETKSKSGAQPGKAPKVKLVKGPVATEWLRWTHEATVVEVAQLADGRDYVLTFETGQIGLILRPLARMMNHWDIYVGYVPPLPTDPANLDKMLDPQTILSPALAGVGLAPAFEVAEAKESIPELERKTEEARKQLSRAEEVRRLWQTLTPRERQVAALVHQEFSTNKIASELGIKPGTVQDHINKTMRKFNVHSRSRLRQALNKVFR